jgi:HK97 gp10 family phage protein
MAYEKSTFEIKGLSELLSKIDKLPREFSEKMEKTVLKKALQKVHDLAVANAPVISGKLANSIKVKTKKDRGANSLMGQVMASAPYAHLVEFGHVQKGPSPKNKLVGVVPPHPFLRPAFYSQVDEMLKSAEDEMIRQYEKFKKKGLI